MRKSQEVVIAVVKVSVVVVETLRRPPGSLLLRAVVVRLGGVIEAGRVSVLRHVADVRQEGLGGAPVIVGELPQAAGQVGGRRHAVALPAGHLLRRPLRRRAQDALRPRRHGLPAGGNGVGGGAQLRRGAVCSSGNGGSMADE